MDYLNTVNTIEKTYTRDGLLSIIRNEYPNASDDSLSYNLRKMLSDGDIIRVGWNKYTRSRNKRIYRHSYSDFAVQAAEQIDRDFHDVKFQIFELIQLNEFTNHQIAHNTIFVYVEQDMIDFVFDSMKRQYPGRTMLKPKIDEYYRYLQDDEIIIGRLPTESPKGTEVFWQSKLEKILVDITVDKLLRQIVPASEFENIFHSAYEQYFLDEGTMIRYAKRRGAESKFMSILNQYAPKENQI